MSVDGRMDSARSRLEEVEYERAAGDFVRYRPEEVDDAVAALVRTVVAEGWSGAEEFRRGLSPDGVDTLGLFARRRILLARRASSMSAVYEFLDAVALLPSPEDVAWDSWVKAGLFVARSLGGDAQMLNRQFEDVASEDLVARWHVALESMNRVEDLAQCRMAEVSTSYGVGLVEFLTFPDRAGGIYRAPALARRPVSYAPTTNLAELAVRVADSLDATGTVETSPIGQDQLAATSFALSAAGSYLETTGCLSFAASGRDGAASFLVYVAELPEETDVESLADAAAATDDQSALYEGRRLVVLSPQPNFEDVEDEPVDFGAVDPLVLAALADPATQ